MRVKLEIDAHNWMISFECWTLLDYYIRIWPREPLNDFTKEKKIDDLSSAAAVIDQRETRGVRWDQLASWPMNDCN